MEKRTIDEVLREHTGSLMSIPGVVGIAKGKRAGKPCIRVFVVRKTPHLTERIPSLIEGYAVVVQETGRIRALGTNDQHPTDTTDNADLDLRHNWYWCRAGSRGNCPHR